MLSVAFASPHYPAVLDWPIRSLVARDQSAGGVRDRKGPEPAPAHFDLAQVLATTAM
jgi:hypothetical protein